MSKVKQTNVGSDIYRRIREAKMSDFERQAAIASMRKAEGIVDALFWLKGKFAAAGTFFLKPSLKH